MIFHIVSIQAINLYKTQPYIMTPNLVPKMSTVFFHAQTGSPEVPMPGIFNIAWMVSLCDQTKSGLQNRAEFIELDILGWNANTIKQFAVPFTILGLSEVKVNIIGESAASGRTDCKESHLSISCSRIHVEH